MIDARAPHEKLRQMFAGHVENALYSEIGLADPELVAYLTALLVRFVHMDTIFPPSRLDGQRIEGIAQLLEEMSGDTISLRKERDVHRHVGDFTLFWSGLYPEALRFGRSRVGGQRDALLDYSVRGKQSYLRAAQLSDAGNDIPPRKLLQRLSTHYELCARGLEIVSRHLRPRQVSFNASQKSDAKLLEG